MMPASTVYYLPGYGGQISTGLGQGLLERGFAVAGRETRGGFKDLGFLDQVAVVADDLKNNFWSENAYVVANSFGGYLFLHAQAGMPPYPGKVLLLSPIIGGFSDEATMRVFSPPYESRLLEIAQAGQYPRPINAAVHTGSEDWQSHPDAVKHFFGLLNIQVTVANGRGHMLGKDYVGALLDMWLPGSTV